MGLTLHICQVSLSLLHLLTEFCMALCGSMTVMGLLTFAFILATTRTRWRTGPARGWHPQTSSTQCSITSQQHPQLGYAATRILHGQLYRRSSSWYVLVEELPFRQARVLNVGIITVSIHNTSNPPIDAYRRQHDAYGSMAASGLTGAILNQPVR